MQYEWVQGMHTLPRWWCDDNPITWLDWALWFHDAAAGDNGVFYIGWRHEIIREGINIDRLEIIREGINIDKLGGGIATDGRCVI